MLNLLNFILGFFGLTTKGVIKKLQDTLTSAEYLLAATRKDADRYFNLFQQVSTEVGAMEKQVQEALAELAKYKAHFDVANKNIDTFVEAFNNFLVALDKEELARKGRLGPKALAESREVLSTARNAVTDALVALQHKVDMTDHAPNLSDEVIPTNKTTEIPAV